MAGTGPVIDKGLKSLLTCKVMNVCVSSVAVAGKETPTRRRKSFLMLRAVLRTVGKSLDRSCVLKRRTEQSLKGTSVG